MDGRPVDVHDKRPTPESEADLLFALKLVKHTKSNTVVFAKNGQLLASGTGKQAGRCPEASRRKGWVWVRPERLGVASDAFFPFPDCVELAAEAGVAAVIQPGGSINDQKSIDACNASGLAMYTTGVRHFRH